MTAFTARWTCALVLTIGGHTMAQTRTFLALDGQQGTAPTSGSTEIVMVPGTTATLMVWIEGNTTGLLLGGYQVILPDTATPLSTAGGSIHYVDNAPGAGNGDSIRVDTQRGDWVYALTSRTPPLYNETPTSGIFGVIYNAQPGTGVDLTDGTHVPLPGGIHYLAEFDVAVSSDACGAFELPFHFAPPPSTSFFDPEGGEYVIDEFQSLIIDTVSGPTNDACADAASVIDGTYVLDTVCATTDGPDQPGPPPDGCQQFGLATHVHRDVWYEYVAPCTGTLTVSTCNSADFDTRIALYDGLSPCPPEPDDLLTCNDSIFGCLFTAEINTPTMIGTTYLIRIGGPTPEDSGAGAWSITCTPACPVGLPVNDPRILADCGAPNCMDVGCDLELGCVFFQQPGGGPCDNGDPCVVNDTCDANGQCIDGTCDCTTIADCADVDHDGVRDDGCTWWACASNVCTSTAVVFADMGSQFGACPPDGTADGNDRFQALNCFANVDPNAPGELFPCEDAAPAAFNVDTGGQFGSCAPDGVCDGNDAFAALAAFENTTTCTCPSGGPAPAAPHMPLEDIATISLHATRAHVDPGGLVDVLVYLMTPLKELRGYQLHVGVAGGSRGAIELVDISIQDSARDHRTRPTIGRAHPVDHTQHVFEDRRYWDAYNTQTMQMLVGLDGRGTAVAKGYLATFTFRASESASGTFIIELMADHRDPTHRTFLFSNVPGTRIGVKSTPLRIRVE